jgi:hypothetical protein
MHIKLLQTSSATRAIWAASACLLFACSGKPSEAAEPPSVEEPPKPPAEPAPSAAPAPSTELPAIPAGAKVWFIEPADGAKVQGPLESGKVSVAVKMGAENIQVKPAGQIEAGSGHHHILIDIDPEAAGTVVSKDEQHLHFGLGQTETTLQLTPGEHTLRLQFADGIHRSYGSALAATIKINAAEGAAVAAAPAKTADQTADKAVHAHPAANAAKATHKH